jgi:hypothetical protein
MSFNPALQLNIKYVFNRLGIFELLQFDSSGFSNHTSMNAILAKMKELNFFESSMAYLKSTTPAESSIEKDEFGNYNFKKIHGEDYSPVTIDNLIAKLQFEDEELQFFLSTKEVHYLMAHNIKRHTTPNEFFYELTIPTENKEKMAPSPFWDNFRSFIGVDKQRKIIHLITTGID